jgi:hypothetical protein
MPPITVTKLLCFYQIFKKMFKDLFVRKENQMILMSDFTPIEKNAMKTL